MTRRTLCLLTVAIALTGASACSNDTSPTFPTPPAATQVLQGAWSSASCRRRRGVSCMWLSA